VVLAGVRSCRGRGAGCCACGTHVAIIKTCSQFLVLGSWFTVLGFELFSAPAYAVFGDFD
jgi:hypothetical protein